VEKKEKNKSPSFPLFQRGIKSKVISPLWKRGVRGDFYSFKSPFVHFSKGGKKGKDKSPFIPLFLRGIIK